MRSAICSTYGWPLLAAALLIGCDGGTDGGVDEDCGGHGQMPCPDEMTDFTKLPDGGEIRLERLDWGDGTFANINNAYFFKDQSPAQMKFPEFPGCTKMTAAVLAGDTRFPLNPNGYESGNRTYLDFGPQITLSEPGGKSIVFNRYKQEDYPTLVDAMVAGRKHDIAYYGNGGGADPKPYDGHSVSDMVYGAEYTVNIEGKTFKNKQVIPLELSVSQPAGLPSTTTAVQISRSQDFTVKWDFQEQDISKYTGPGWFTFIAFIDDTADWTLCLYNALDRQATIPAATMGGLPNSGNFFVGVGTHFFENFEGRRLDMVSTNCKIAPYTLQ
jgi:hypothetical protein